MMNKKLGQLLLKEVVLRWIGICAISILATYTLDKHLLYLSIWLCLGISFIFTAVLWNGAIVIMHLMRRKYPAMNQTGRRLFFTSFGMVLWLVFGAIPLRVLLTETTLRDLTRFGTYLEHSVFNFTVALIMCTIYEGSYYFHKWKESFKLAQELKNQHIKMQFEVLQNQMSPHFLFNSLNTLVTLIAEDQKKAISFTENLSEVYRYILQNKDKELVSLEDELAFAKSYVFLLRMRYPENLEVDFEVMETGHEHIAPLTLQMLIENAIKHNVISKANPLKITVRSDQQGKVVVQNNLQTKRTLVDSTKTGLANIQNRYRYLGNREISIVPGPDTFSVMIPLIKLLDEKDILISPA